LEKNLKNLALVAEIIAAIGVILSLIFVGFQLSEGNRETRAATTHAVAESQLTLMSELLRYADVWEKVVASEALESGAEARRGIILYNLVMTDNENVYFQQQSGFVEDSAWESRLNNLTFLSSLPVYSDWRISVGGLVHDPGFLAIVDAKHEESRSK